MEVLGTEFDGMSPQELAAPVNTVAVSLDETFILFCHEHRRANANIVATSKNHIRARKTVSPKSS